MVRDVRWTCGGDQFTISSSTQSLRGTPGASVMPHVNFTPIKKINKIIH